MVRTSSPSPLLASCFAVRNTLARKIAGIQALSGAGMQPCGLTAAGPLTGNGQMSHQDCNMRAQVHFPKTPAFQEVRLPRRIADMAEPARAKPKPTPETQHFWD